MAKQEETPTPIDLTQRVTVFSTEKDVYHGTGDEMNISPLIAEKLLKNGLAAKTKEEALKTKGGK